MARIARLSYTEDFNQLSEESFKLNENNDCTVKAMAVLTGKPYAEVHAAFKAAGRKDRQGADFWIQKKAAEALGFSLRRLTREDEQAIIAQYPGAQKGLANITTRHPVRFAKVWQQLPPMMLHVRAHVAAFKDGKLHDWSVNKAMRVIDIYVVEPIGSAKIKLPEPLTTDLDAYKAAQQKRFTNRYNGWKKFS